MNDFNTTNSQEMDNLAREEFSNNVKDYLELEEQISKLNIALRERRTKLKALSNMIIRNMEQNDIHHINIKNGVLVYKNDTFYKGLNKKNLMNGLSIYFNNDEQKTKEATSTVLENRERINKIRLKLQRF